MIRSVVMVLFVGLKVINMLDTFSMMFDMVMVKCFGLMVVIIRGCGIRAINGEKESLYVNFINLECAPG
mgnify:CR=1 FL=1